MQALAVSPQGDAIVAPPFDGNINMLKNSLLTAAVLGLLSAGCAVAQNAGPAKLADTAKGKTLVDAKGMTLYSFDKDMPGKSVCNGPCAQNWPAFAAGTAAPTGDWTIVTRDDGGKQWAYKGRALYTFAKDTAAGEIKGDGFLNGAWHVAQP